MVRKKSSRTKDKILKKGNIELQSEEILEDKIINAIVNTSVILMSMMMGAFTQVIGSTMGAMVSGMAEAMGGKESSNKVNLEINQGLPEIDAKMKAMISDLRKDIYSQMRQKRQELEPMLGQKAFMIGPEIIEKYDFNLPKLTQELDDNAIARYLLLLISEDVCFGKMFKELTEWINSISKPNKASQ